MTGGPRPRVLLLAASADLYGSDKVLLDLVDVLRDTYEVVVALPATGPLVAQLERRGTSAVMLEDYVMRKRNLRPGAVLGWSIRVARSARRLFAMQRNEPFAAVYSNTLAVPLGPLLRMRFGIPHIWHAHEVLEGAAWFRRSIAFASSRGSDAIVCVSKSVERQLCSIDPAVAQKTIVVYNAVDIPMQTKECVPMRSRRTFGCVGRLYPRKGHLLLLHALERARSAGTDCELVIFGDPLPNTTYLDEMLAAIEALGLRDVVTLRGFEAHEEDIYSKFDVLVLPSIEPEALPLACLEAHAWGLPVIGPDEGGPAEIVIDGVTGLLSRPRDVDSLADAIAVLAAQPEVCRRMGEAGRRRIVENFGRDAFSRSIRNVVAQQTRKVPSRRRLIPIGHRSGGIAP